MIELVKIRKVYRTGQVVYEALKGIHMKVNPGEFIAIMGPSGSGKSTLMNLLGCLDTPTEGFYFLEGEDVAGLSFDQLSEIRNKKIGFVFQSFNLLLYSTAFENIELPMLFDGIGRRERRERVEMLLERVGLKEWADHRPTEMSGGQQQRVAIARALANDPPIILADEPTGNLDSKSGKEIMDLFTELNREGKTILMVTHDHGIAGYARRKVEILDGQISTDTPNGFGHPTSPTPESPV